MRGLKDAGIIDRGKPRPFEGTEIILTGFRIRLGLQRNYFLNKEPRIPRTI